MSGGFAMPTQTGTIWAQWVGYNWVLNTVHTYSLYPNNRDITAEAALALHSSTKNDHWSETGISQIVSNGVNETFDPPIPMIKRSNVTQITFRTAASSQTRVYGRHVVHYWT
jgi:hypothetical protein